MNGTLILVALFAFPLGEEDPAGDFDVMAFLADPQEQPTPVPSSTSSGSGFVDLDQLEGKAWAGMLMYSEDFESGSMPAAGIVLRAPMPWLSDPGATEDDFGFFVQFTGGQVDRDLTFLQEKSGTVFFIGAGADYALVDEESWMLRAQLGIQYENFGGVTDLEDGFATIIGLDGSLDIGSGIRIGVTPQWFLADAGDWVFAVQFGLSFRF